MHSVCPIPGAIDLSVGLRPSGTIAKPRNQSVVGAAALAFAAGLVRCIEIGVQRRGRALRQNADDGVGFAFEQNALTKPMAVAVEGRASEAIAENRSLGPVQSILFLCEVAGT
jgi:hypothetical protein